MTTPRFPLVSLAAVAAFAFVINPDSRAEVWSLGHGDIGVAYDPLDPAAFEMEVHAEQGATIDGVVVTDPDGQAF